MNPRIFFAYASGHQQITDAIKHAVKQFNSHQGSWEAYTWEDLFISGRPINRIILQSIREAEVFACDLSTLNENVLFELGYAIGQRRKILIFLNTNMPTAAPAYNAFKVLKGVGYAPYRNAKEIQKVLSKQAEQAEYLFVQEIEDRHALNDPAGVLVITSGQQDQASVELAEFLAQTDFHTISDDAYEVEYQSFIWYIRSIYEAEAVVVHNAPPDSPGGRNQIGAFFAGLARGLGKEVLFIAPAPRNAPIDYEDLVMEYSSAEECALKTNDWLQDRIKKRRPTPVPVKDLNLIKLGLGCEVAEEEREILPQYFIENDPYSKALDRKIALIVGRKGSGKTAIFIKLAHDLAEDQGAYCVVLKPDSDELVQHTELSTRFESESGRRGFFNSVWRFVILSKLMLTVEQRIQKKVRAAHHFSDAETSIVQFCIKHKDLANLNFYGAMRRLADGLGGSINLQALDSLYKDYLNEALDLLKCYFKQNPYTSIRVLADNLDKSWDARSDLHIQSEMILRLLEYGDRIVQDLALEGLKGVKYNCVVLLRKDIFDFIRRNSREPDKLTGAMQEIDWSRTPGLLRQVVERRVRVILSLPEHDDLRAIWERYFDLQEGADPVKRATDSVVPRPRDVIYFFGKLFEAAANNGRTRVEGTDWKYANEVYGTFLRQSILAEIKAEQPDITLLMEVVDEGANSSGEIELTDLVERVKKRNQLTDVHALLDGLFKREYLVGRFGKEQICDSRGLKDAEDRIRFWTRDSIILQFGRSTSVSG